MSNPTNPLENLPEPVRVQRRSSRAAGIAMIALAAVYFIAMFGVLLHFPLISDLFGTNPRMAVVLGVIGAICLVAGIGILRFQANNPEALREMAYGQADERYRLIRAKAGSAAGTTMFTLIPFAILGLKMAGSIDVTGMAVFLGVWFAGVVAAAVSTVYFQKRL